MYVQVMQPDRSPVSTVVMAAADRPPLRLSSRARSPQTRRPSSPSARCRPGTKDNVIPDDRAQAQRPPLRRGLRRRVLDAIERIVNAEATASGAPDRRKITTTEHYPLTVNDPGRTRRSPLRCVPFGEDRVHELDARSRPARTSDPSAPNGTSPRCSGTSAAPTRRLSRRRAGRSRRPGHPYQPQPRLRPRDPPDAETGVRPSPRRRCGAPPKKPCPTETPSTDRDRGGRARRRQRRRRPRVAARALAALAEAGPTARPASTQPSERSSRAPPRHRSSALRAGGRRRERRSACPADSLTSSARRREVSPMAVRC